MYESEVRAVDFFVVCNDEEQYSIWRSDKPLPSGWTALGAPMPKEQCLKRIEELWTDMRPKSLREFDASPSFALEEESERLFQASATPLSAR